MNYFQHCALVSGEFHMNTTRTFDRQKMDDVKALVEDGLVEHVCDEGDRCVFRVTEEGKRRAESLGEPVAD